jgi:SAM-dependent methyltransferase
MVYGIDMSSSKQKRFDAVKNSKTFNNILEELGLGNKNVLDIGCSYGEFLAQFGPGSVGLNLSESEATIGRQYGLDIRLINIEEYKTDSTELGKFDAIFANNIFEHMQSPHNFLIKIKRFLNPGGVLVLGVPCIPILPGLVHLKKFQGALADLHINFFVKKTLEKSVEYAGWIIKDTRGFRFRNRLLDHCLDPIYPHFYVIASPDSNFTVSMKRQRELAGYKKTVS